MTFDNKKQRTQANTKVSELASFKLGGNESSKLSVS